MKIIHPLHALALSIFCCFGTIASAAPPVVKAAPAAANKISLAISGIKLKSEALSFQFGAENTINIGGASSGGGGAGKATFKELVITRRVDSFSPDLLNALLTGKHFDEVIITQEGLTIEGRLAMVADYRIDAESGRDGYQVETLTLMIDKATVAVAR